MTRRNKNIGDWGEYQAGEFLKRQGFELVERNFFTTTGEIDIVARKGGDYYFVEVKTRLNRALATDGAVTPAKIRKFFKAVKCYSYRRDLPETGLVMAAVIVLVNRSSRTVNFRFFTFNNLS